MHISRSAISIGRPLVFAHPHLRTTEPATYSLIVVNCDGSGVRGDSDSVGLGVGLDPDSFHLFEGGDSDSPGLSEGCDSDLIGLGSRVMCGSSRCTQQDES